MACADSLRAAWSPRPPVSPAPRTAPLSHSVGSALQQAWRNYWRRRARRATLSLLRSLDDRALKDIGIDRSEIASVLCGGGEERRICVGWVER
jgi:uncharacterized protein YjiS (DUF1127 family)